MAGAACLLVLLAYGPALRGPFLFDDLTLPFSSPAQAGAPLLAWLSWVRPVLMLSYWLNHKLSSGATLSYHLVNVALHLMNAFLVFFILYRLLQMTHVRRHDSRLLAGFGAGLFLLHPIQTEAVAYIAGRSEVLSALFFLAALAIYIDRAGRGITWRAAAAILALFAAGAATKEHIVAALPAALLLTEWHIHRARFGDALRRDYRLYAPMLVAGLAGGAFVWKVLSNAPSAGSNLSVTPWQYLYTSSRVIFNYLRLCLLPLGQNFDPDITISRTWTDHGAFIALAGLVLVIAAALYVRRRHPLVCYGLLWFLILLAPTSSVIPLADPMAEHRMYLPLIGLLVVLTSLLAGSRANRDRLALAMVAMLISAAALTYQRCVIWSDAIVFWKDVVAKSPHKARPYPHLTYSLVNANRCGEAVGALESAGASLPRDYYILMNWAIAYDCTGQPEKALAKLREAAALNASADVYALMGQIMSRQGRLTEALEALGTAIAKAAPDSDMQHLYRGHWYAIAKSIDAAEAEYRRALEANPGNSEARSALAALSADRATKRSGAGSLPFRVLN